MNQILNWKIKFKVKSHSSNLFNEQADLLAKEGLTKTVFTNINKLGFTNATLHHTMES